MNANVPEFVEIPWQKEKLGQIKQMIYKIIAIHHLASIDVFVDAYRFFIDTPFVNGSLKEVNSGGYK